MKAKLAAVAGGCLLLYLTFSFFSSSIFNAPPNDAFEMNAEATQAAAGPPTPTPTNEPTPTPEPTMTPRQKRVAARVARKAARDAAREARKEQDEQDAQSRLDSIQQQNAVRDDGIASMAKYDRISSGMSYDDVVAIAGEGTPCASVNTPDGGQGEVYQWVNGDGSWMKVGFDNGQEITKAQNGLPNGP